MRSRFIALALVTVAVLAVVPSGAALETDSGLRRQISGWFGGYDPNSGHYVEGSLFAYRIDGVEGTDASLAQKAEYRATAYLLDCLPADVCASVGFNWQTITPTAIDADPLLNVVRFNACLLPSDAGACRNFQLTFDQPKTLSPAFMCFPAVVCGANAWIDKDQAVHAEIVWQPGISRWGYRMTGTFAGTPVDQFPPLAWADVSAWQSVTLDQMADLP